MILKDGSREIIVRLYIYLYVMHFAQGSMLVLDLSNKKKRIAPRFLYLAEDEKNYEKLS